MGVKKTMNLILTKLGIIEFLTVFNCCNVLIKLKFDLDIVLVFISTLTNSIYIKGTCILSQTTKSGESDGGCYTLDQGTSRRWAPRQIWMFRIDRFATL